MTTQKRKIHQNETYISNSAEFEAYVLNLADQERLECLDPLDILLMLEDQDLLNQLFDE